MPTIFRPPLVTRVARPLHAQAVLNSEGGVWSNRLLNLLRSQDKFFGSAGMAPDYDYPNPRGRVPSIELRTFINPMEVQLIGQDKFFGGAGQPPTQRDWPVPKGPVPATVLRTWTDPVKLNLLGQDKFFGLAGNPTFDWPVPNGRTPGLSLKTWLDTVRLQLIGTDQFYGAPGQPPANADWPVAPGRMGVIELRTWIEELLQTTLAPSLQAPFSLLEWPVPSGARARDLTWVVDLLQTTLAPEQSQSPFFLLDWSTPVGPRYKGVDLLNEWQSFYGTVAPAAGPTAFIAIVND